MSDYYHDADIKIFFNNHRQRQQYTGIDSLMPRHLENNTKIHWDDEARAAEFLRWEKVLLLIFRDINVISIVLPNKSRGSLCEKLQQVGI